MNFIEKYCQEIMQIVKQLDHKIIHKAAEIIADTRSHNGRIFFLGVGGSAANASHAVNDFRKIVGLEAYAPTDNVSELTARTNDDGWESVFVNWLRGSHLAKKDLVFVLSVGGGNLEKNISPNIVAALKYAREVGTRIIGVVGRDGGFTAQTADCCIIIPMVNPAHVTPHTEGMQMVICHLLISHPLLKATQTKWEAVEKNAEC
jgi:D-sedoheptulose 7-phosphate isomerase